MTTLHGWLGYGLLAGAFLAMIWLLYRAGKSEPVDDPIQDWESLLLGALIVEVLLGLFLVFLSSGALSQRPLHPLIMLAAVVLVFVERQRYAEARPSIRAALYAGAALLLLLGIASGI